MCILIVCIVIVSNSMFKYFTRAKIKMFCLQNGPTYEDVGRSPASRNLSILILVYSLTTVHLLYNGLWIMFSIYLFECIPFYLRSFTKQVILHS